MNKHNFIIKPLLLIVFALFISSTAKGQSGEVRGFIQDKETGEVILFATVKDTASKRGVLSDANGFYVFPSLTPGKHTFLVEAFGYESLIVTVEVADGGYLTKNIYLNSSVYEISKTVITFDKLGVIKPITPEVMAHLPSIGGEPDIVQYLQILPGVITSGDQGGQLYIRGGSPIMNKVLLDGITIYNPFHSIGLFSVFDADIIRTVDVHSAAFGAEYGGRLSAIMDIKTRDGNKQQLSGILSSNTFSSKLLLEGPLRKFKEGEGSTSFILSYKNSYLDKTSQSIYSYANEEEDLPYSFSDFYGKISIDSRNGSKVNFFGFNYNDMVNFTSTQYEWHSTGFGSRFLLVPDGSRNIIDGFFSYSDYGIQQIEADNLPRRSDINGFDVGLNFNYFLKNDHLKWGIQMNGFTTNFEFYNAANRRIYQVNNTTELSGFWNYKHETKRLVLEPGFRVQLYPSIGNISAEPRFNMRYYKTDRLVFKLGAGLYSQNFLSAISDRDVVNLFYGFLSGPEELPDQVGDKAVTQKIQKAKHALVGAEYRLSTSSTVLFESYLKDFNQIININRDKIFDDNNQNLDQPDYLKKDFIVETGLAYGFDFRYRLSNDDWYLWATYSYTYVDRFDGIREYNPHFDRRHNVNLLAAYQFGKENSFEVNARWSYGSGFPFTQTQGFYENLTFDQGISTDYTSTNGQLGIQFADINQGRQPEFHRFDMSVKKKFQFYKTELRDDTKFKKETGELNIIASCTNIYNRENIFYFNRVSYERINQLPILPSLGINYHF